MYIFSKSSLEKQSKIGSWQRTQLPSPLTPALLLPHLDPCLLLLQGQRAPTRSPLQHPPALCQLGLGCSVSVQSQQREQTLWVCREIEVCGCCL